MFSCEFLQKLPRPSERRPPDSGSDHFDAPSSAAQGGVHACVQCQAASFAPFPAVTVPLSIFISPSKPNRNDLQPCNVIVLTYFELKVCVSEMQAHTSLSACL